MLASIHSTFRTLLLASAATLVVGCSADASAPDAATGGTVDARVTQPRIDAMPFGIPDAMVPGPDAMPACTDSNEPNETSGAATSLSAIPVEDDDGAGGAFTGTVQDTDEDWFTYLGDDTLGDVVDPTVEVVGGAVEVCMYMDCVNPGPQTADCPQGTTADMNGDLEGCCAPSGFTVALDCTGADDDANIYIRVKATNAGVCESYSASYHY